MNDKVCQRTCVKTKAQHTGQQEEARLAASTQQCPLNILVGPRQKDRWTWWQMLWEQHHSSYIKWAFEKKALSDWKSQLCLWINVQIFFSDSVGVGSALIGNRHGQSPPAGILGCVFLPEMHASVKALSPAESSTLPNPSPLRISSLWRKCFSNDMVTVNYTSCKEKHFLKFLNQAFLKIKIS